MTLIKEYKEFLDNIKLKHNLKSFNKIEIPISRGNKLEYLINIIVNSSENILITIKSPYSSKVGNRFCQLNIDCSIVNKERILNSILLLKNDLNLFKKFLKVFRFKSCNNQIELLNITFNYEECIFSHYVKIHEGSLLYYKDFKIEDKHLLWSADNIWDINEHDWYNGKEGNCQLGKINLGYDKKGNRWIVINCNNINFSIIYNNSDKKYATGLINIILSSDEMITEIRNICNRDDILKDNKNIYYNVDKNKLIYFKFIRNVINMK